MTLTRNGTNISVAVMFVEKYGHMVLLPKLLLSKKEQTTKRYIISFIKFTVKVSTMNKIQIVWKAQKIS